MLIDLRFVTRVLILLPLLAWPLGAIGAEIPSVVEVVVSMENSLRPRIKGKLPQVRIRMDLSQYSGAFDGNLAQMKRLNIDYATAYVNAYQKAYVKDRSLLSNTYPFSSILESLISTIGARGRLDNLVIDKKIFLGEKIHDGLKSQLDDLAEVFELSGELAFTQEWLNRLGLLNKEIQDQRDLLERVRAGAEGSAGTLRNRHKVFKEEVLERVGQVKRSRELGIILSIIGLGLSLALLFLTKLIKSRVSLRTRVALFAIVAGLSGLQGSRGSAQVIHVEMTDSIVGAVKLRTPKVLVAIDLEKYPGALSTNLEQAKKLMLDYTSAYVSAYEKAYLEDRELPIQFSPIKAYLAGRLEELRTMDSPRMINITPEEFRGEMESSALKAGLNRIVLSFESSGDFLAVQSWVQNIEFVRKNVEELEKFRKEIKLGLVEVTEKDMEELNAEATELGRMLTEETEKLAQARWIVFGSLALSVMVSGFAVLRTFG